MQLHGQSLLGISGALADKAGATFTAFDPRTQQPLEQVFHSASLADVEKAAQLAGVAAPVLRALPAAEKARFLELIALKLEGAKDQLIESATLESGLPTPRITGEVGRTAGQLRLFASLLKEGVWLDARLDTPDASRAPLPKPDLRSMLRSLGPVAVFGASNFPLAFSVAGGDTAAAFAAGCPVICKAHAAHPATGEIVGRLICEAARECELPEGTFSLLFDKGYEVGTALVEQPQVKAVGFTGSRAGGLALMRAAASREEPIPVFAEMSSINPIVISAGALDERGAAIASGLSGAVTLGVGQFCTNPGLVLLPVGEAGDKFAADLRAAMSEVAPAPMLTKGIGEAYVKGAANLAENKAITALLEPKSESQNAGAGLFEAPVAALLQKPELLDEVFGPSTLLARYETSAELLEFVARLEGQLTATLQITEKELLENAELVAALEEKVGRLIINGFPTGVEVGHAMVHGGPFPATSDGQSTSVGSMAIKRFTRPVCFQNFPDAALPDELKSANPLGIFRLVDGKMTRE